MIYVLGYTKKDILLLATFFTLISIMILSFCFPTLFFQREKEYNWCEINNTTSVEEQNLSKKISGQVIEVANIKEKVVTKESEKNETKENNEVEEISIEKIKEEKNEWRIKIPIIDVDAPITEGTTQDILAESVGHFEESNIWNGNVALAGHNRGYQCNFFQNIKKLKEGDIIIYQTAKGERKYKVILNKVIKETNWSYIENTEDNRITLITCEENKREYRRCIQGIEMKEGEEK